MVDMIERILREECRLDKDKPILAGVSGGPDSLCLLTLLHEAGWKIAAAYFNHQLRPEAGEEAEAVEALARQMQVPFVGGAGEVRQYAGEQKLSTEAAARELRYRFLFEQARHHEAQAVAVGHTADDQVETVLMHFIRGAGLNGLTGMQYRSLLPNYDAHIPLVRPLLDMWRTETIAYCGEHHLQPHYDLSNDSMDFLRNRVRHELIPALETYNPRFREAVWRAGRALAADHALLERVVQETWKAVSRRKYALYVMLNLDLLAAQPREMQTHILQRAAQMLAPDCEAGFEALQRAAAFVADPAQERVDFIGGLFLLREGDRLYVASDEEDLPRDHWPQMPRGVDSMRFTASFDAALAAGWTFSASVCALGELPDSWKDADAFQAWIDAPGPTQELEVRVRREGDRFQPLGMDGHSQKLSDFFVNVKLTARARARWPLLCVGDEVIWVAGYRPAERVRVRPESTNLLHLAVQAPPRRAA